MHERDDDAQFLRVIWSKLSPAVVFVHFVLILHPRVSVHKELQEGEGGHASESYEGHWERTKVSTITIHFIGGRTESVPAALPVPPLADDST